MDCATCADEEKDKNDKSSSMNNKYSVQLPSRPISNPKEMLEVWDTARMVR